MRPWAKNFETRKIDLAMLLLLAVVGVAGCKQKGTTASVESGGQTTFASPDEAGRTLQDGVKTSDQSGVAQILGPGSTEKF